MRGGKFSTAREYGQFLAGEQHGVGLRRLVNKLRYIVDAAGHRSA